MFAKVVMHVQSYEANFLLTVTDAICVHLHKYIFTLKRVFVNFI